MWLLEESALCNTEVSGCQSFLQKWEHDAGSRLCLYICIEGCDGAGMIYHVYCVTKHIRGLASEKDS
jgi:hypothetical protein